MKYERVLALSPHTDDIELGAGATLSRLAEEGAEIQFITFSAPDDRLRSECHKATVRLMKKLSITLEILDYPRRHFPEHRQDILQTLWDYRENGFNPTLILTPSTFDLHQDHQVITDEGQRAFKNASIYGYILRWNCRSVREDVKVPIETRHMDRKIHALSAYESQKGRSYFDPIYQRSEAYVRGLNTASHLAESFELINLTHQEANK